eukprot:7216243-Pyramimonas_sp.AAC.1
MTLIRTDTTSLLLLDLGSGSETRQGSKRKEEGGRREENKNDLIRLLGCCLPGSTVMRISLHLSSTNNKQPSNRILKRYAH